MYTYIYVHHQSVSHIVWIFYLLDIGVISGRLRIYTFGVVRAVMLEVMRSLRQQTAPLPLPSDIATLSQTDKSGRQMRCSCSVTF